MSNEVSSISTLRNVSSSEEQFRAACAVDEDRDGSGEFGTFAEMSGAEPPRGSGRVLNSPMLSGAFQSRTVGGEVKRGGYQFQLWLPARNGRFVTESARNIDARVLDPAASEQRWRCYSWPSMYDHTGLRTFFIDERGDLWCTDDARYSGSGSGPAPGAADVRPGTLVPATVSADATFTGADGNVWRRMN